MLPFVIFIILDVIFLVLPSKCQVGDVFFADMSVSIVRPYCLENLSAGLLPQKWMGQNVAPIYSWGGCDVDYEWQIPGVEYWLKQHGIQAE